MGASRGRPASDPGRDRTAEGQGLRPPEPITYAGLTRNDPNRLKRWLQRRRLADALRVAEAWQTRAPAVVLDYGGGDGELSAMAAARWPQAHVVCFEPASRFRVEAEARLGRLPRVDVVGDEDELPEQADLVFCTEVLEHLPPEEGAAALERIHAVLSPEGLLVAGVPVEVGPPALAKGLFRMARRSGAEDARLADVLAAALGRPPRREVGEVAPGRRYLHAHLGFDHRVLARDLERRFKVEGKRASPFAFAPVWANAEVYFTARRR